MIGITCAGEPRRGNEQVETKSGADSSFANVNSLGGVDSQCYCIVGCWQSISESTGWYRPEARVGGGGGVAVEYYSRHLAQLRPQLTMKCM